MTRRIANAISLAAVFSAICMSIAAANAAPVNRPLADKLTRQYNRQELQALHSGAGGLYSRPAVAFPSAGMSRAVGPRRPLWHYMRR